MCLAIRNYSDICLHLCTVVCKYFTTVNCQGVHVCIHLHILLLRSQHVHCTLKSSSSMFFALNNSTVFPVYLPCRSLEISATCRTMEYRGLIPTPPAISSKSELGSPGLGSKKKFPPTLIWTLLPTQHFDRHEPKKKKKKTRQERWLRMSQIQFSYQLLTASYLQSWSNIIWHMTRLPHSLLTQIIMLFVIITIVRMELAL